VILEQGNMRTRIFGDEFAFVKQHDQNLKLKTNKTKMGIHQVVVLLFRCKGECGELVGVSR